MNHNFGCVVTPRMLKLKTQWALFPKNDKNKTTVQSWEDEVRTVFHQKCFKGQIADPKSAGKSLWYIGEIKTLTWYHVSLFPTPPTHSQTRECSKGGVFVAAKGTGHKFKSPLYAVKRVDSDERCCRQTQCRVKGSLVYTSIPQGYSRLRNHSSRIPLCS